MHSLDVCKISNTSEITLNTFVYYKQMDQYISRPTRWCTETHQWALAFLLRGADRVYRIQVPARNVQFTWMATGRSVVQRQLRLIFTSSDWGSWLSQCAQCGNVLMLVFCCGAFGCQINSVEKIVSRVFQMCSVFLPPSLSLSLYHYYIAGTHFLRLH